MKNSDSSNKVEHSKKFQHRFEKCFTNWSNAITNRNITLYNPLTGLAQTGLEVKEYVKSVFGATSLKFKQPNGLEFTNVKDR